MAKILLVDDDELLVRMYQKKLENGGHKVITASDGQIAIQTALQEKPDLVILDIRMPKMDGMQAMHRLREDEWGKTVPIIMLTNVDYLNNSMREGASSDHPIYYLVKSNTRPDKVLKKINEIINFLTEERLR